MSNFELTKTANKNILQGKLVAVKPSMASFTEIPELNRSREAWDLEKVHSLTMSIRNKGILNPTIGYVEGKTFKIVRGAQRLKIAQALEADNHKLPDGSPVLLPIILIPKPTGTKEEIKKFLLDGIDDNEQRYEDDFKTRLQSFQSLRTLGMTLEEIAENTGFSHTFVAQHLKVGEVPILTNAVNANKLGVKQAAVFTTKGFMKADEKGEKTYDEAKIKSALTEAIADANKTGSAKVLGVHTNKHRKGTTTDGKSTSRGLSWFKRILDAPAEDVELAFRLFIRVYLGQLSVEEGIKKSKGELAWLADIDFEPKKKAAKKAAAKKAATTKASNKKNELVESDDDEEFEYLEEDD